MTLTPLNAIRERAEQARKLVEATSPGPWDGCSMKHGDSQDPGGISRQFWIETGFAAWGDTVQVVDGGFTSGIILASDPRYDQAQRDIEFIAASPTLVRELLDTQERLIAALELAVRQRNTMYGDPPAYPEIVEPERSAFDAALAAILEPKLNP